MMRSIHPSRLIKVAAAVALVTCTGSAHAQEPEAAAVDAPPTIADTSTMDPGLVRLIEELLADVAANPASAEARAELGLAYEGNTIWSLAEQCYDQSLRLDPEGTEWLFRRGICRFASGDLEAAVADLRATADVFKSTPVVHARLADALRIAGDLEGAEGAWRQAIEAEERQPQVVRYAASRVGLAQSLLDLERAEEAAVLCREALELAPGYRHAHYTLGLALLELGQDEEGEAELLAGENAYPEFPPGPHTSRLQAYGRGFGRRMMIIENLVQSGNLAEANRRLEEILESRGDEYLVLNLAARVAQRGGDGARARELLSRSLEASPDEPSTLIQSCLLDLQEAGQIASQLSSMQQLAASGATPDAAVVTQLQERGAARCTTALASASAAAAAAPTVGSNHYWVGVSHQTTASFAADQNAMGQSLQAALSSFQMAQRLGCTEPGFNLQLSNLYAQMGRAREMLRFALRHLDTVPRDPSALSTVIQALISSERAEETRPYIERLRVAGAGQLPSLQFCVQAYLTIRAFDSAEATLAEFETAGAGNPQVAQFVTAVQAHIARERAAPAAGGDRP
ncbi:MAG: tetratricopeptide repeat protein [Planctomycetota bacterium]|nr:tetratricopeptide repeat protein [Planctomycetota bacterium]MDG1984457.1 tetratricopeptide repeat protein [Planctomycetota bacterium]